MTINCANIAPACDSLNNVSALAGVVLATAVALTALGPLAVEQVKATRSGFLNAARMAKVTRFALALLFPTVLLSGLCVIATVYTECASVAVETGLEATVAVSAATLIMSTLLFAFVLWSTLGSTRRS